MSQPSRICLVSASGQNAFFGEILEAFGEALTEAGVTIERSVDCFPLPEEDLVFLYVPHEFHPLVHELASPSGAQMARSVAICTEQPGTHWFEVGCGFGAHAGGVVDINVLGVDEMRRRGIAAEHAPLGYVPSWDLWGGDESRERPIDLTFLGSHTARRDGVLARCAPLAAERNAVFHITEPAQPHLVGSSHFLSGERKWRHLADSKVLLNIHQQDLGYMEWHRVIGAALNGCVVLSEHAIGTAPFHPGEHFISASYGHLSEVLTALLDEPERLREVRQAAYACVREEMQMRWGVEALLRAAERANAAPLPRSRGPRPLPMPADPPERAPDWLNYAEWVGDQLPTRRALKDLVVRTRDLERRLERAEGADGKADAVQAFGPRLSDPRVSVLLTVHNYADLVGEALRSVAFSELEGIEVIAVDDASTDDSVRAVAEICSELPWLPVKHVRLGHNRGLPAARNLAAGHARSDLLFVLDADNAVFPHGIRLLTEALEARPDAGFAYGMLEVFDMNGPLGLQSWIDWDPHRLRHGNFIDAMALIRRSALEAVGGYSTHSAFAGGWEDFALWVAMADAGIEGLRVPNFVGRYREAAHSMRAITNVDVSATWATLIRKYPVLTEKVEAQGATV